MDSTTLTPEPLANPIEVSFEFSPPRTPEAEELLWSSIKRLEPLSPSFVSVTYGAGGSTRTRTHETVRRIMSETNLTAAAHLTCVDASREEVDAIADEYWQTGVRHIVALRGDPPAGEAHFVPREDGYRYACDLVEGLKRLHDFEISVACYPEVHPEAPSAAADLDNLKRKIDAGATRAISQFFFDNPTFLRFRERAAAAGIKVPIVPGLIPLHNLTQIAKFAEKQGTPVPQEIWDAFAGLEDEPNIRQFVAATVALKQVNELKREGVEELHFYTLNRADLTYAICHLAGLRAAQPIEASS